MESKKEPAVPDVEDALPLVDPAALVGCASPAIAAAAAQAGEARTGAVSWNTKDWNADWNNRRH